MPTLDLRNSSTSAVDASAALPSLDFAIQIARLLADSRCEDVIALDVQGQSQVTDFVVIGTGTSERQMWSVGAEVANLGKESGHAVFRHNSERASTWTIVDFVDVTVHLFEPNTRAFYDLEHLWPDAVRLNWRRTPAEEAAALQDRRRRAAKAAGGASESDGGPIATGADAISSNDEERE